MTASTQPARGRSRALVKINNALPIPLRLADEERNEVFAMAEKEERSVSNFARQVFKIGLEHYKKMGHLPAAGAAPELNAQ